jgi:hypothetical protein
MQIIGDLVWSPRDHPVAAPIDVSAVRFAKRLGGGSRRPDCPRCGAGPRRPHVVGRCITCLRGVRPQADPLSHAAVRRRDVRSGLWFPNAPPVHRGPNRGTATHADRPVGCRRGRRWGAARRSGVVEVRLPRWVAGRRAACLRQRAQATRSPGPRTADGPEEHARLVRHRQFQQERRRAPSFVLSSSGGCSSGRGRRSPDTAVSGVRSASGVNRGDWDGRVRPGGALRPAPAGRAPGRRRDAGAAVAGALQVGAGDAEDPSVLDGRQVAAGGVAHGPLA